jgi:hypothetical protein
MRSAGQRNMLKSEVKLDIHFGHNLFERVSSEVSVFDFTPPVVEISLSLNSRLCAIPYRVMEVRGYAWTSDSRENYPDKDIKWSLEV